MKQKFSQRLKKKMNKKPTHIDNFHYRKKKKKINIRVLQGPYKDQVFKIY